MSGGIAYETKNTLRPHTRRPPATFFTEVFEGSSRTGCRYLQGQDLDKYDYRVRADLGQGARLYAFGHQDQHHFYIIRPDRPDHVLNGLLKGLSRPQFESLLRTIRLK